MMQSIIMLIAYFAIVLAISIVGYRCTRTHKDYLLGGRNLGSVVTALGVGASDMSGWLMLGLPGAIYLCGFNQLWMPIGLLLGAGINWQFIAKRLRAYTVITNDALTLPSFLAQRFAGRNVVLRLLSALIILVAFTFYCAAGLVGAAKLFSLLFDVSYMQALLISAPIIIIYTLVGGFLAVNWVDLFQGTLILFALLVVPSVVVSHLGGWATIWAQLPRITPSYTHLLGNMQPVVVASLLAWGLGYFGQPHILVRFMAVRSLPDLTVARNVCMLWMTIALAAAVAVGVLGRLFFVHNPTFTLSDPELVFLSLAEVLFNPWLVGILLAAVLSAIMSTVAAQLMASASALQEDLYHAYLRPNARGAELLWVGRITVALVAILALGVATDSHTRVLSLVAYAWGGLGATFGPVILGALFWRRMNAAGALGGLLAGVGGMGVFGILLAQVAPWCDIYALLPGFICGIIGVLLGTYCFGKPPSAKVTDEFTLMLDSLRK